ncbi:MAG: DNA topoisomerase I [Candidatus Woesearchaeota archaeon]
MSYELIICEKPSAAKNVAQALADGKAIKKAEKGVPYYEVTHGKTDIVVASAVGHLYGLVQKDKKKKWTYPIFDIEWAPLDSAEKETGNATKFINVIAKLAKKAKSFTIACDYDIEGEVIGLNVIRYAAGQKDAKRMKFSTQTKPDLIEAYEHASPHIDWLQAEAGETRHMLDWYFGINLSRALTDSIKSVGAFKVMSTGRVQGPALKLIVDKEKEIQKFKPDPYWEIELLGHAKLDIEAMHEKDKFWDKKDADKVMHKVKNAKTAKIKSTETKQFNQSPPVPFDLTSLQIEAHGLLGISPKIALSMAQELYIGGYISYPRTSSQKLPKEIGYKKIITALSKQHEFVKSAEFLLSKDSLVPNEGPKTDPAHPAIFPTGIEPKGLKTPVRHLYDLIVRRFFAVFGPDAIRESVKLIIDCNGENFIAHGTTTLEKGWHNLYGPYAVFKEVELPKLAEGDEVKVKKITLFDKETQPPKRYTESSIIKELEKRNLGTKSTRAQIIDTLVQRGYVSGKSLEATELGIRMIDTLHKYCPQIIDEELTRNFEDDMERIREKKTNEHKILDAAKKVLLDIFKQFDIHKPKIGKELLAANRETQHQASMIGLCPKCKKGELHLRRSKFGFFIACSGYPECKTTFSVPKNGLIQPAQKECDKCHYPMILLIQKGKRPRDVCINQECPSKELHGEAKKEAHAYETGKIKKKCPTCKEGDLVLRSSIYGQFLGCSTYPKCRYTEKLQSNEPKKEDHDHKEHKK